MRNQVRLIKHTPEAVIEGFRGAFKVVADKEEYEDGSYRVLVLAEDLLTIHDAAQVKVTYNNSRVIERALK
jgi:hypothetical protein